jgi:hypothetical protein
MLLAVIGCGATRTTFERKYVFLAIFSISAISPFIARSIPSRVLSVVPPHTAFNSVISGQGWAYTVGFRVENPSDIEKLIQCESQGVNISRPDSDGIVSDGILQFHRSSRTAPLGSGTWAWMSSLSGIQGSPIDPASAIRMTDWAISHGWIGQWSCARIQHLI